MLGHRYSVLCRLSYTSGVYQTRGLSLHSLSRYIPWKLGPESRRGPRSLETTRPRPDPHLTYDSHKRHVVDQRHTSHRTILHFLYGHHTRPSTDTLTDLTSTLSTLTSRQVSHYTSVLLTLTSRSPGPGPSSSLLLLRLKPTEPSVLDPLRYL